MSFSTVRNNHSLNEEFKRSPTIFMFSGQGSQFYQMGRGLYESNATFKHRLQSLDSLFYLEAGYSIVEYLYDDKKLRSEPFEKISLTHPAIFMIELALANTLIDEGIKPDGVMGASLGELCAAVVAGIISAHEAIKIVIKQATIFEKLDSGAMLAVLYDLELYYLTPAINQTCDIAAVNSQKNFVIAGTRENIAEVTELLKDKGIVYQYLPVKQAFHSSCIDHIKEHFNEEMRSFTTFAAKLPYYSCLSASKVTHIDTSYFFNVIRDPIRVSDTIRYLEARGPFNYVDLGPSGTLANSVKYNISQSGGSKPLSVMSPFGDDTTRLNNVLSTLKI
ncbi:Polyketide biosynthesis acyltransferase BaeD [Pseudoalteromonas holothuriae]|uniref:Polyketide biosynthesis acyltransferase BaeD n=1 Tax=Pseudoalteromonas holothuriae TaxID=2963714 RepID=A0ABM9GNA1_9GAMM|nr:acyltransferase domain-containing protein [Pseudoalteromonas sp. CIP111951]CAH9068055.1 Polyketide biosynthesis acyltransferase BaeD [Pseudoalteromonas sp. CIP111951]